MGKVTSNGEKLDFRQIFRNKKISILTLDERWHALFPEEDMPENIKKLRDELNNLLKKQGRAVEEIKGLKRYKSQLMQEIVINMEVDDSFLGKLKAKKLEKNQKLILNVKEQLLNWEDELANIPYEIKDANEELMSASAVIWYDRIGKSSKKSKELEKDIQTMRSQLKEMIIEKQDLEMDTSSIYSYMHDMLGPKVMEILDEEVFKN